MTLFLTRRYLQPFLHHNLSYPTSSYFALGTSKASSCHQFLLQASLVSPYFHLLNPPLPPHVSATSTYIRTFSLGGEQGRRWQTFLLFGYSLNLESLLKIHFTSPTEGKTCNSFFHYFISFPSILCFMYIDSHTEVKAAYWSLWSSTLLNSTRVNVNCKVGSVLN